MTKLKEKVETPEASPSSFSWPTEWSRLYVYIGGCIVFLLAEFAYTMDHPHVRFETWFGFNAAMGLLGVLAIVGLAIVGRGILGYVEDDSDV